jgi:hypothetical protein
LYSFLLSFICFLIVSATVFDCIYRCLYEENVEDKEKNKFIKDQKESVCSEIELSKAKRPREKGRYTVFVLNCSLYANIEKLFRTDNGGKITCLNGLRAMSMMWIILYHSFRYLITFDDFIFLSNLISNTFEVNL